MGSVAAVNAARPKLTMKERRFLAIIYPAGTIATGSDVGAKLYYRGFVTIAKRDRYGITPEGAAAIALTRKLFGTLGDRTMTNDDELPLPLPPWPRIPEGWDAAAIVPRRTSALSIGAMVFVKTDARVYRKVPGSWRSSGGPIPRYQYEVRKIVAESRVSWLLAWFDRQTDRFDKVPKRDLSKIYGINDVDDVLWTGEHQVQDRARSPTSARRPGDGPMSAAIDHANFGTGVLMTFLVWRRGLRGPVISKDGMDPRQSIDWKLHEARTIAIVALDEQTADMHLSTLEVLYPCPAVEA